MSYRPNRLSAEFTVSEVEDELQLIADALASLESDRLYLVPQISEPFRAKEGTIAVADGTEWNPGAGAGIYEYKGATWVKL